MINEDTGRKKTQNTQQKRQAGRDAGEALHYSYDNQTLTMDRSVKGIAGP